MKVIPVLDILNGLVVRGIAGKRSEYRPIESTLTTSTEPLDVARSIREAFGLSEMYLADLDAILHQSPNWDLYRTLTSDGFRLQIDAGIRDVEQSLRVQQCDARPIVGLELCPGPLVLAELHDANHGHVTFSLDMLNGQPIIAQHAQGWSSSPIEIVRQAVATGITRLIVLDLADVGTSNGGRTESLCRQILSEFPASKVTCGGGVRGADDLQRISLMGVDGVLVASALHDGRLTKSDVRDRSISPAS